VLAYELSNKDIKDKEDVTKICESFQYVVIDTLSKYCTLSYSFLDFPNHTIFGNPLQTLTFSQSTLQQLFVILI